jgi:cation transport ATPase
MDVGPDWLKAAAFALATMSGGLLVFPAGWMALLARRLDMNVLMTVAVAGAWIIGEHAESAKQTRRTLMRQPQPNHISKSAIAALTFPAAPAAIIRVVAIGTDHRLARNAARTSFSGGWSRTD